ncbi:MAG TPA: L-lactate permease [Solirubrobacteraceae bacterium]|nr:L-lactate permease [Solirubrobacteraceae bacterium]
MYKQVLDPVANSLAWSTLFAVLPLVTLFVLLGGFRLKAHVAALWSLLVALLVAIIVYSMPVGQALDSGLEGAAFGLFPIMWIVVNAIWIYAMLERSGHFAVIKRSFARLSEDERVQAVLIAFCFGALLEALAGFGTPVAICSVMLIGLGFKPAKAAAVSLVANTAPVAFGAIAVPITTLAPLAGLPKDDLGAMVGRQTPFLALIVPLILIGMVDGWRGIRATWPVAVWGGLAFAIGQFACSNYLSVELADIVASLLSAGVIVGILQVWQPGETLAAGGEGAARPAMAGGETNVDQARFTKEATRRSGATGDGRLKRDTPGEMLVAFSPYLIIIAVFSLAQIHWLPFFDWLDARTKAFDWPGLNVLNAKGEAPTAVTFKFNWANAAGTLLLVSGLLSMITLRVSPKRSLEAYWATLKQLKFAILTVASVLALAYVMNLSGQTITIANWLAGAGAAFALLSPILGWLGVAVTGSDTSSNALFGALQVSAAEKANLSPMLMAASNSSGGVLGKMISPQNLAIGAAAVGMAGQEGDLFRRVVKWSLILLAAMVVLVYLQSTSVLSWMVVGS